MKEVIQSHHPVRTAKSFKYAFKGIGHALINEPNFRIQLFIAIGAIIMGIYFEISNVEWGLLTLSMGLLLMAEMVNTVVEEFIDNLIQEESDVVRIIKDLSAGFVLTAAITSFIILLLVFGNHIIGLIP